MLQVSLGLVLFLGIHSVSIVVEAVRDRIVDRHEGAWKAFYSLVSLAGLVLIVRGYADARSTSTLLYAPPTAIRHVAATLMLPVFVLLFAPYFPGRIQRATQHPMLLGVMLWAVAHLLANGTLGDVVLFGAFLAWAIANRLSFRRRTPRALPGAPAKPFNDGLVVVLGIAAYAVMALWAHVWLFGVSPLLR